MVTIIKELAGALKDLPDTAIWIMFGILFYKFFVIGGTMGLIKFAIKELHNYLTLKQEIKAKPVEIVKKYSINKRFITCDGTMDLFEDLLDLIRTGVSINSKYIHKQDDEFCIEAVKEKREKAASKRAVR